MNFIENSIDLDKYLFLSKRVVEQIIGKENIKSIILFGSFARNEANKNSDIDILFIVSNDVPNKEIAKVRKVFFILSEKLTGNFSNSTFLSKILWSVKRNTGMKISGFICRESDFISWNFPNIFGSNKILSRLLAPKRAVLYTILNNYKILYGEDPFRELRVSKNLLKSSISDILKSFVMNFLLAMGALFIAPLYRKAYQYSMEAIKWSLLAYSYATNKTPSILKLVRDLKNKLPAIYSIHQDKNPEVQPTSPLFYLETLRIVLKLHLLSLTKA